MEPSEDLRLTRDEVERIGDALKKPEFRKLLHDYVEEVRDPENQRVYQEEITQLEKERGYDVTFINPTAGYVIKTSLDGTKKCFINVCKSDNIERPSSKRMSKDGKSGLNWHLPFSLTPPREDIDRKGVRCKVFDVVFHPDTLYLAANNKAFLTMVNTTACEAVETNFNVKLDCKNLKFPKMQYKGMTHPTMIRKKSQTDREINPEADDFMGKLFDSMPKVEEKEPVKFKVKKDDDVSKYTIPTYTIKHRTSIELEEFTDNKNSKLNCTIPKELVIEINLPLLKSANDILLDVMEKSVQLTSEKPSKYKLDLTLPYAVNQDNGNAKFEQDKKKLTITLPVKQKNVIDICRDDSGVESDQGSPTSSLKENYNSELITEELPKKLEDELRISETEFLDTKTHYNFPEFTSHLYENTLTFTLQVWNVDESSIDRLISQNSLHVKFTTISSGFFPVYYSFYVQLPDFKKDAVLVEVWDNNLVIQIPLESNQPLIKMKSVFVGLSPNQLEENFLDEPIPSISTSSETSSVTLEPREDNIGDSEPKNRLFSKKKSKRAKNVKLEVEKLNEEENKPMISRAIDIERNRHVSESSGDELTSSFSPTRRSKGILKRLGRSSSSRSVSESSIDEVAWASSVENCHMSLDSVIPEDGSETSSSLKKTVRFNDFVLRQLYRSNSSILGQKRKNQRKARNKKRAQERRHSESELSELDELKERDPKTEADGSNGIFDFDI